MKLGDQDKPVYLFSIDLEDVRTMVEGGERYRPRVVETTRRYLRFLERLGARCTFFCVGRTVRENVGLIKEIAAAGHELACHTDLHRPLTELTPQAFREDLRRNIGSLREAGVEDVIGFRAPMFSLVERTAWAHEVLGEEGIEYSSSVLPAKSPLFGWEGFGSVPRRVGRVMELPMTLRGKRPLNVPFGGGVYFRSLPWAVVRRAFANRVQQRRSEPLGQGGTVLGYFHPYDIDTEQERFMHPGIGNSRFYNYLMYRNRGDVMRRLDEVMAMGFRIMTYRDFVATLPGRDGAA